MTCLAGLLNTMSDTYPHICRIEDSTALSWSHKRHLRKVADTICRRTGLFCSYNKFNSSLLFHNSPEPFGGPLSLNAFHPDGSEKRYTDPQIDEAVEFVGICRVGRKAKDVWKARQDQREKWERHDLMNTKLDERRPDAKSYAAFIDRKRRGVEKIVSLAP